MDIIDFGIKLFSIDLEKLKSDIAAMNEERIVDENRDQLLKGKDNENKNIQPKYASAEYADYKQSKNSQPEFGIPDLKDTGDFQDKMILAISSDNFMITSTDEKTPELTVKYLDIFGLNEKSLEVVQYNLTDQLQNEFIKRSGLD
jgi:hypothetical protein